MKFSTNRALAEARRLDDALAFDCVAQYDRMRLDIYRRRGARISTETVGKSLLLRFDEVGYFNTVYGCEEDLIDRLDEVEAFFSGSPHGCRLLTPTLTHMSPLARACAARGWTPHSGYAWLSAEPLPEDRDLRGRFDIRVPESSEHRLFFQLYLTAFGAEPNRFAAAIENMRHLFSSPDLHFFFACDGGRPVGVGMMFTIGNSALLCAGGMLPEYRGSGGQSELLAARIEHARLLGCTDIHSWAESGGHSHANIERCGLQTVRTTLSLRLRAEQLAPQ